MCTVVQEGIDKFIPKTTPGRHKPKRKWIDKEAMKSIKKKNNKHGKSIVCAKMNKTTKTIRKVEIKQQDLVGQPNTNEKKLASIKTINPFGATLDPNQKPNQRLRSKRHTCRWNNNK